jgi:hypothetical protein
LLSVGGLQVSFLKLLIDKIFNNMKKTGKIVNVIFIGIYTYVLNFASGILRVWFTLLISYCFKKYLKGKYESLALSGIITIFIEPSCVFNYGFCLSYLCTYFVI